MNKDRAMGALILLISIIVIVIYGWLVFGTIWSSLVINITAFLAILIIFVILGWIGYTMLTTSPPAPIEPESEMPQESSEKKE